MKKNALSLEISRRGMLQLMAAGATASVLPLDTQARPRATHASRGTTPSTDSALGAPLERADGRLKVTGHATYAIEHEIKNLAYGVMVQSTIAAGRVKQIDTARASGAPGVIGVYTHENAPGIFLPVVFSKGGSATENFLPLQDDKVRWNGQHIAFVVAESLEQATEAASLLAVEYEVSPSMLLAEARDTRTTPMDRLKVHWGNAQEALESADARVDGVYTTPREYNLPIEPHACIAAWEGGHLTVWEPSQWIGGAAAVISQWMGIDVEKVRVISPFVGGAFGCKVAPHPHVAVTCAVSRHIGRPIKTALTRPQTFTGYGGRPKTHQELSLGARKDGTLVSIDHRSWNETAIDDIHVEPCNAVTPIMYACRNFSSEHALRAVHTVNPGWMRAPGENPSAFALETAMDELAYAVGMDPLELRLRNYAEFDPKSKIPWSTRRLKEAYAAGAQAFGWDKRNPRPRSMREGRELIGYGMASGTYPVRRTPGQARLIIDSQGRVEVRSAGIDMGTGTYTILAQTVSDVFALSTEKITVSLGDGNFPLSPMAGGSQLANVLVGAVYKAALIARAELFALATEHPRSPLYRANPTDLLLEDNQIRPNRRLRGGVDVGKLLRLVGRSSIDVLADTFKERPGEQDLSEAYRTGKRTLPPTDGGLSAHAWSAQFVEVRVDEDFGTVRVRRMVGAYDSGRVFNPKLARSQWMGGMIMGLGQALLEDGVFDQRDGRVVSASLADYLVAVNADVPDITTISVGEPDLRATALGGKAVGELGIVGVAAAIGNAVYHATGKRVRDLPITMEKLL